MAWRGMGVSPMTVDLPEERKESPGGTPVPRARILVSTHALQIPPLKDAPLADPAGPSAARDESLVLAPDPAKPRRLEYGDAVRVIGTIAVVVNHCCDMSLFIE